MTSPAAGLFVDASLRQSTFLFPSHPLCLTGMSKWQMKPIIFVCAFHIRYRGIVLNNVVSISLFHESHLL